MNLIEAYLVLRLQVGAPAAQVRSSYLRLARNEHPDKNPTARDLATRRFQRIGKAYRVIKENQVKCTLLIALKTKCPFWWRMFQAGHAVVNLEEEEGGDNVNNENDVIILDDEDDDIVFIEEIILID